MKYIDKPTAKHHSLLPLVENSNIPCLYIVPLIRDNRETSSEENPQSSFATIPASKHHDSEYLSFIYYLFFRGSIDGTNGEKILRWFGSIDTGRK